MSRHDDAMRRSAKDRLRQAIRDLHGLESEHIRSEHVHETFQGKTIWEGDVEVFSVAGHPNAQTAFAWSYKDDDGTAHYVAVLGVPPVDTPQEAVRAVIATAARKHLKT